TVLLAGFQARGTLGRFLVDGVKMVRIQGEEVKVAARIRQFDEYSGHADGPELARWIAARRPIRRGVFLVHGEEPALKGLSERIAERSIPAAQAVTNLDWHNDMSRLILDINERMQAAADDRARGVVIRRLRRALEAE